MLRTLGTVAPGVETRVDGPDPAGTTERNQMHLRIEAGRVALEDCEIVGRLDGDNPGRRHPQREVDGRGADIGARIAITGSLPCATRCATRARISAVEAH